MNILAIDTSTEACSAALLRDDGAVFGEYAVAPRQHTTLLPAMMDGVLQASGLDKSAITHCAFANGPGAFTGIRIAAAQAQGIGIALNIPLLPISTLAVLAQTGFDCLDCRRILTALDARMGEIYWATYQRDENGHARLVGVERLGAANEIDIADDVDCGIGHGWSDELRDRVGFEIDAGLLPDARALLKLAESSARLGLGVAAGAVGINYLRNRVAEKAKL
ncbi:MAG: tRNA (adenosine(37)-N6)-threonylcarbamoyltransferase complex dimerization subunit type 1 TsaB [Gammaproteobacteria bacterium]|nr:tRNA (adenosine(37)-N6)-threonylcarbamoyltransferase complex dimerization subunit type 1 TsaB [Gammaproteobacteria bacterium]MDH3446753.1 tRNA (adenosine(37)-N6)-threonylcarbamoyltransferase complex dimerization subunit type 1 TsaB [Gammaproteobacteria bacterium]